MDNDLPDIPWGVALRLYKFQIIKRLQKEYKLSIKEATTLIADSYSKEEARIKSILEELVNENP